MATKSKPVQTTTVTGYFNGTGHRLNINSNALGLNVTLEKGAFLTDADGNKINDPRLEQFVGERGFSRQIGDPVPFHIIGPNTRTGIGITAAPVVRQPAPVAVPANAVNNLRRLPTQALVTDRGTVPPRTAAPAAIGSPGFAGSPTRPLPQRPGFTPAGINPAVRVMPVAEAEQYGIIGRAHRPVEGLEARDRDGISAKDAPYADEVIRPARPTPRAVVNHGPSVRITTPVGAPDTPPAQPTLSAPAHFPQPNIDEEQPISLSDQDAGPVEESTQEAAPVYEPLPAPVIKNPARPFVCVLDGKDFTHYSTLSRHVRQKYPDRVAEILAQYQDAPHG